MSVCTGTQSPEQRKYTLKLILGIKVEEFVLVSFLIFVVFSIGL